MKTSHLRIRTVNFKAPSNDMRLPTGPEFSEWLLALPEPPTGAALAMSGLRHGFGGIVFFYPVDVYGERVPPKPRPPLRVVH